MAISTESAPLVTLDKLFPIPGLCRGSSRVGESEDNRTPISGRANSGWMLVMANQSLRVFYVLYNFICHPYSKER